MNTKIIYGHTRGIYSDREAWNSLIESVENRLLHRWFTLVFNLLKSCDLDQLWTVSNDLLEISVSVRISAVGIT